MMKGTVPHRHSRKAMRGPAESMNLPMNRRAATPPMTAATLLLAIWACGRVGRVCVQGDKVVRCCVGLRTRARARRTTLLLPKGHVSCTLDSLRSSLMVVIRAAGAKEETKAHMKPNHLCVIMGEAGVKNE